MVCSFSGLALRALVSSLASPDLLSRAIGVAQSLAAFSSPTCFFCPSGVMPVGLVPGGLTRPPFGTLGVGHIRLATVRGIPARLVFWRSMNVSGVSRSLAIEATGVGQSVTASCRSGPPAPRCARLLLAPPVAVFGVGHFSGEHKNSFAFVAGADFRRAEYSAFNLVIQSAKVSPYVIEAEVDEIADVFDEHPFGLNFGDDAGDIVPEPSRVFLGELLAGNTDGLTGEAGSDEMNAATPWVAVECGNVIPDRRWIQRRVFHPRHESCRSVGFALDVTNTAGGWLGDFDPEVETSSPGCKAEDVEGPWVGAGRYCGGM